MSQPDAGPGARRAAERSEPQALALKLWTVLARAYASVLAHSQADIARHGLTPGEFAVLEVLYHKGPLLLRDIQRKILVSSGGITFLVDSLEKRGLVERRECKEDRRARYAALTPEGERFIAGVFEEHATAIERAVSGLDVDDRRVAIDLLKRLGHHAASLARVRARPVEWARRGRPGPGKPHPASGHPRDRRFPNRRDARRPSRQPLHPRRHPPPGSAAGTISQY